MLTFATPDAIGELRDSFYSLLLKKFDESRTDDPTSSALGSLFESFPVGDSESDDQGGAKVHFGYPPEVLRLL